MGLSLNAAVSQARDPMARPGDGVAWATLERCSHPADVGTLGWLPQRHESSLRPVPPLQDAARCGGARVPDDRPQDARRLGQHRRALAHERAAAAGA